MLIVHQPRNPFKMRGTEIHSYFTGNSYRKSTTQRKDGQILDIPTIRCGPKRCKKTRFGSLIFSEVAELKELKTPKLKLIIRKKQLITCPLSPHPAPQTKKTWLCFKHCKHEKHAKRSHRFLWLPVDAQNRVLRVGK